ncbi:type IV toxin-antitoxin system AbiEi family antitoxin domain-containing protein [Paenibacillus glycinis]|uniref:AbiEi antitoxin C-terminal domain-containing protein n=1 Tax=Paenibacillus glycinis TaxID=2697035 RepID=A0ABW9Y061_9BACL|nr:hypothetical protein [Paenibacillus glycinis]NBD28378.1 hypothetical protein [Paenibacillus glycinis]
MGRLGRVGVMKKNIDQILNYMNNMGNGIFTYDSLQGLLQQIKEEDIVPKSLKLTEFINYVILEKNMMNAVDVKLPQRGTTRFLSGDISPYRLALTFNKESYLSHYSAVFVHQLTNNIPRKIYTNMEQASKWYVDYDPNDPEDQLIQKNIDLAFSRPMRETNQKASFNLNEHNYEVFLLNGKNHNRLGITKIKMDGEELTVTDLERTLIDIVVRPNYSGGVVEVLEAYKAAKGRVSVNKLLATLKKMKFKYPYHQLIGLYLERAGYPENVFKLFTPFSLDHDFYLTYGMKDKKYSDRWRVYYPKGF